MWAKIINAAIGIYLMAAPSVFGYVGRSAEYNDRIVGPVVAALAVVSLWDCTRHLDRVNLLSAAWLVLAPVVLGLSTGGYPVAAAVGDVVAGVLIFPLALVKGSVSGRNGGGWMLLFRPDPYGVTGTSPESPTRVP